MKTINYSKLALMATIVSFSIGTLLFLLYKLFNIGRAIDFGIMYIPIAFLVNSIILLLVLIEAYFNKTIRKELILHGSLMLVNIPIAILYISTF